MRAAVQSFGYEPVKRVLDAAAACIGLIVVSPILVILAALIARKMGRPVLYKQDRPGMGGRVFRLYKFRTMLDMDPSLGLLTDEQRLTPFGRALRSASLDELPTLFNVLRGDMSVVGPRPLLVKYLERYTPEQAKRHLVRPGITGLAQVSGRNSLSWELKFAFDVSYVEHQSLVLDLKILARTIRSVVRREGISEAGHATASEFIGTSPGSVGS